MAGSANRLGLVGGEDHHSETVAQFISKVWKIVEKPEYNHLITWSNSGKTFLVKDYPTFSKEVLPLFFKHSNFNSFVRQLNLYGFRKVAKPDQGSLAKSQSEEVLEFWHTNFRRGHPELLHLVHRKGTSRALEMKATKNTTRVGGGGGSDDEKHHPHLSKVMNDIHQMKGRQESIASVLDVLKQDNAHLRHEIALLKDKHVRQQRVLNKIIQFLVHMVYKGKLPARRTRNTSGRLMLMDSESLPPARKRRRTSSEELLDMPVTEFPVSDSSPPAAGDLAYILPLDSQPVSSVPSILPGPSVQAYLSEQINSPSNSGMAVSPPMSSSDSLLQAVSTTISSPSTPASIPITSPSNSGENQQFPPIASDILAEYPIHAAPSSLLPVPHPENRHCINGHLNHQQQGIDAIPDMLSGQLSLDPSIIAEFLSVEHLPVPDYDTVDTARLLESLTTDNDAISHESALQQKNALVPVSLLSDPTLLSVAPPSPGLQNEPDTPTLHQLLESNTD